MTLSPTTNRAWKKGRNQKTISLGNLLGKKMAEIEMTALWREPRGRMRDRPEHRRNRGIRADNTKKGTDLKSVSVFFFSEGLAGRDATISPAYARPTFEGVRIIDQGPPRLANLQRELAWNYHQPGPKRQEKRERLLSVHERETILAVSRR